MEARRAADVRSGTLNLDRIGSLSSCRPKDDGELSEVADAALLSGEAFGDKAPCRDETRISSNSSVVSTVPVSAPF